MLIDKQAARFSPIMKRIKNIHFTGIGGSGMCGIAEVLLNEGYHITGSDLVNSEAVQHLITLGITVYPDHQAAYIDGVDALVISAAIDSKNPEIIAARKKRIPVVQRAEMLSALMRFRHGIAIAGTHGKTTTTSLLASLFAHCQLDPTFVIGGRLNAFGSNARLGSSDYLIVEADESDASFLHLQPMVIVVTNIDHDHMEAYHNNFKELKKTFIDFVHQVPFYGLVVLGIDCPIIREIIPCIQRRIITYGLHPEANIRATDIHQDYLDNHFKVQVNGSDQTYPVRLSIPGIHNVQNALAVWAVAMDEGLNPKQIIQGLENFQGVGRRFEIHHLVHFAGKPFTLIDDYGHHPEEISKTIMTARSIWPTRRILMIFQPHRYSRTIYLFNEFVEVLVKVDCLILLDVYSAGEKFISHGDSLSLLKAINNKKPQLITHYASFAQALNVLEKLVQDDDIVLLQGAGTVSTLKESLLSKKVT